jgi:hypothetical protein
MDKPKREAILDLGKYSGERIRVKFTGGREGLATTLARILLNALTMCRLYAVTGILKGYDQLLNLVLDEVEEHLQGKPLFFRSFHCSEHASQNPNLTRVHSASSSCAGLQSPSSAPSTALARSPTHSRRRSDHTRPKI